jgi:hypothetical protein
MGIRDALLGHFVYHKWNIPTVVMLARRLCRQGQADFCRRPITNRDGSGETVSGLRVLTEGEVVSRNERDFSDSLPGCIQGSAYGPHRDRCPVFSIRSPLVNPEGLPAVRVAEVLQKSHI